MITLTKTQKLVIAAQKNEMITRIKESDLYNIMVDKSLKCSKTVTRDPMDLYDVVSLYVAKYLVMRTTMGRRGKIVDNADGVLKMLTVNHLNDIAQDLK